MAAMARRATSPVTSSSRETNDLDLAIAPDPGAASDKTASKPELTRSQVADRLGVSLSTVRRFEGDRLHPKVGPDNVRWFDADEVAALAREVLKERPPTERPKTKARAGADREAELPAGEIAARVFERLEERHSLAEIVVAVRVEPAVVRELYHQWLVGLQQGELARKTPSLTTGPDRSVDQATFVRLISALPLGVRTRISVARHVGDHWVSEEVGEVPKLVELGGFVTTGPVDLTAITDRYGNGDMRVTAYQLDPRECLWEVFVNVKAPT